VKQYNDESMRHACGYALITLSLALTCGCGALIGIEDIESREDASATDATSGDAATVPDARADMGAPLDGSLDAPSGNTDSGADARVDAECIPLDSGIVGELALSMFSMWGSAAYNVNNDGRMTLTNSNNNEVGAAWSPVEMPAVSAYDLTWSLRVGPGNIAGDGITFALLEAQAVPYLGDPGDGLGLRSLPMVTGYAVVVDMFQDSGDPTDLAQTTLKLVTMPDFHSVAQTGLAAALNDGNTYSVDVSWRAPSSLTAKLHGPNGSVTMVTSGDPGLATTMPAYLGFTAATGAASDSRNQIAGVNVVDVCMP
jgi:hypothetical protein